MSAHAFHVRGRSFHESGVPLVGEHGIDDAAIGRVGLTPDVALAHHVLQPPGEAARREMQTHRQVAHPQTVVFLFRQLHHHVVLAEVQTVGKNELLLQDGAVSGSPAELRRSTDPRVAGFLDEERDDLAAGGSVQTA